MWLIDFEAKENFSEVNRFAKIGQFTTLIFHRLVGADWGKGRGKVGKGQENNSDRNSSF